MVSHFQGLKWSWIYLLFSLALSAEPLQFQIQGEAAILMNAHTGAVLFEHESKHLQYPASTTKIATALYILKHFGNNLEMLIEADQDSLATMSQEAKRKSKQPSAAFLLEPDGSNIGIKKGEILNLHTLLQGLLISSGNDAANVLAQALGPGIPNFMNKLNVYLQEIGCSQTHFTNPHGLHDPEHQTTAHDLALMTREAMKSSIFCDIVSQTRFMRPKTNKQAATTLLQTNRLLRPGKYYYPKAIGVKTGYHAKAKKTFVAAARLDGRILIVVLLGYEDRKVLLEEAVQLFEMAFNQPKVQRVYLNAGPQNFSRKIPQGHQPLQTFLSEAVNLEYYPAEDPQAKCFLHWDALELPILKDQKVGELQLVSSSGTVLKKIPLKAANEVKKAWPYNWIEFFISIPWIWILEGFLGIAIILGFRKFLTHDKAGHEIG